VLKREVEDCAFLAAGAGRRADELGLDVAGGVEFGRTRVLEQARLVARAGFGVQGQSHTIADGL
jgi:hypothetical protein